MKIKLFAFASAFLLLLACGSGVENENGTDGVIPPNGKPQSIMVDSINLPGDSVYTYANGWMDTAVGCSASKEELPVCFHFFDYQWLYSINENDTTTWPISSSTQFFPKGVGVQVADVGVYLYNDNDDRLFQSKRDWYYVTCSCPSGDSLVNCYVKVSGDVDTIGVRYKYALNAGPKLYFVRYNKDIVWTVFSGGKTDAYIHKRADGTTELVDEGTEIL